MDLIDLYICRNLEKVFDLIDDPRWIPIYQGRRYVKCLDCGQVQPSHFFLEYGGKGLRKNYGHCRECLMQAQKLENYL